MRWLSWLLLIICCTTYGQQLAFNKQVNGDNLTLEYRWLDAGKKHQQLAVNLNKQQMYDLFRSFKQYQPIMADRYSLMAMRRAASQVDPRAANIIVRQQGDHLSVVIKSSQPDNITKWQKKMTHIKQQSFDDYLQANHYTLFSNEMGQQGVKPDHVRFARQSQQILQPIADTMLSTAKGNQRKQINYLLSWVQSIPYDKLENRLSSNGSGYAPPNQLLLDNRGDCDSKSVLTATILHDMYASKKVVLVFLPEHALLGLQLHPGPDDVTFMYKGIKYVYLEPTGPALLKVGQIADHTARLLSQGQTKIEPINFSHQESQSQ